MYFWRNYLQSVWVALDGMSHGRYILFLSTHTVLEMCCNEVREMIEVAVE